MEKSSRAPVEMAELAIVLFWVNLDSPGQNGDFRGRGRDRSIVQLHLPNAAERGLSRRRARVTLTHHHKIVRSRKPKQLP